MFEFLSEYGWTLSTAFMLLVWLLTEIDNNRLRKALESARRITPGMKECAAMAAAVTVPELPPVHAPADIDLD